MIHESFSNTEGMMRLKIVFIFGRVWFIVMGEISHLHGLIGKLFNVGGAEKFCCWIQLFQEFVRGLRGGDKASLGASGGRRPALPLAPAAPTDDTQH